MKALVFNLVAVPLLWGCVSAKTYDALKAEHDANLETLAARNEALRKNEQAIDRLTKQEQSLTAALADEKERVKELDLRIARLEADLARIVKDKSSLEGSVNDMAIALADLQRRKEEADRRIAEFRALLDRFKALIDAGKLKVKIIEGRLVVVVGTDVLFSSGSARLSKDGKAAIGEVALALASIPKRKFQIEGHTDNVPISTAEFPSNWELASARALTVLKTMLEAGMPADRISAASFGQSKPAANNDTADGRAANRRIEIIIVPDLSTLPGFEELKRLSG